MKKRGCLQQGCLVMVSLLLLGLLLLTMGFVLRDMFENAVKDAVGQIRQLTRTTEGTEMVRAESTDTPRPTERAAEKVATETKTATTDAPSGQAAENATPEPSSHVVSWREFLKAYEEWVDAYVLMMQNYEANPSDMTLLADYLGMLQEMAEWSEKAEQFEGELTDDSAALSEYLRTMSRIIQKLAEVG